MEDELATAMEKEVPDELEDKVQKAITICPGDALRFEG